MEVIKFRMFTDPGDFFALGFFDSLGDVSVSAGVQTSTKAVYTNTDTDWSVLFRGAGFAYDPSGDPTGGTIDRMIFRDDTGKKMVTLLPPAWTLDDWFDAINAMGAGDSSLLDALRSGHSVTVVARPSDAGVDTAGNDGNDSLFGSDFDDRLRGHDGADLIKGLAGKDNLLGGDGNDEIKGGAGNDDITGNQGDDDLWGGTWCRYIYL